MAIEGQLKDVGLADICQLLAMGRKSGCLSVTDRSNFGYVYFEQGRIIFSTVLNRPDRLGVVLVKKEVITQEQLDDAVAEQTAHPDRRLGQILVDQTGLTQEQLQEYVSVQIQEAVYHLFTWETGSFHFEAERRPDEHEALLVSLNAESLLLEGARRVDEWSFIEKKVPSTDLLFKVGELPDEDDDEVELTQHQNALLPLLDGSRTVDDIVIESGLVEFDVAKAIYGLVQAGFASSVGKRADSEGGREPGIHRHLELANAFYRAGMLEEAESEYREVLELDPEMPAVLVRLGLVALRTGRNQEALDLMDALPEADRDAVPCLQNRALALEGLGRSKEAMATLERARERAPDHRGLALAHAVSLLKGGRPGAALEAFREYRAMTDGENPEPMYFAYGLLAAASAGDTAEALRIGREGLGLFPASSAILVNLGVVLGRGGETDAAEALYLRAVQQSNAPPQAYKNLGDLALQRGDRDGARAHYEQAIGIDPELGDDVYSKLGDLAYEDGSAEEAHRLWERALELNSENQDARTGLERVTKVE